MRVDVILWANADPVINKATPQIAPMRNGFIYRTSIKAYGSTGDASMSAIF